MHLTVLLQKIANTICKHCLLFPKVMFHCYFPWLAVKKTHTGFKQLLKDSDNVTSDVQVMYNKNLHSFT